MHFIFICLFFFWLHWVFIAMRAFSSCCGWGLLSRAVHRLLTAVAYFAVEHGLQSEGSVTAAHGLHCPLACGIFLDQGLNPCPLHLAGRYFTIKPPESTQVSKCMHFNENNSYSLQSFHINKNETTRLLMWVSYVFHGTFGEFRGQYSVSRANWVFSGKTG